MLYLELHKKDLCREEIEIHPHGLFSNHTHHIPDFLSHQHQHCIEQNHFVEL